jgi:hypothetical protein
MAADTTTVEVLFEDEAQEGLDAKLVPIKLSYFHEGAYTISAITQWEQIKRTLGEIFLDGGWQRTEDQYTIYATRSISNVLINMFKGQDFETVPADRLESALRGKLSLDYFNSKQEEQQQKYNNCRNRLQEHYTFFNNKSEELNKLCQQLNQTKAFSKNFIFHDTLSTMHIPHLRITIIDINEAEDVIEKLCEHGVDASKCKKSNSFIVVIKGVKDEEKFKAFLDNCAQQKNFTQKNSAQKSRCAIM